MRVRLARIQDPTIATMVPRAAFTSAARRIREAIGVPLVAGNRINDPADAEGVLARGEADLVAMARPLLADPAFVAKAAAGRADDINTCIACNQACLDESFAGRAASCMVNPRAGRELEIVPRRAPSPSRVAVVGAGPAGMAAAATAAECGHEVVLFDAAARIGGQFELARRIPGKEEFARTIAYFERRLAGLGVRSRLGATVDADALAAGGFDHVVIATGVLPRVPGLAGVDGPNVAGYADVVAGRRAVGPRVAILGAGGIGFDVAELLTHDAAPLAPEPEPPDDAAANARRLARFVDEWGVDLSGAAPGALRPPSPPAAAREVWLLQRSAGRPGARLPRTTGWIRRATLARRGVRMLGGVEYERIDARGLHLRVDGAPTLLEVDTVVVCAGQEPHDALSAPLRARGVPTTIVGGALEAAELDAVRAFREGTLAALAIGAPAR
jgi:2,4-dienoyl-CoA reductase (NADPH2)